MKNIDRLRTFFLSLLIVFTLPLPAKAAGKIDPSGEVNLYLTAMYEGTAIPNMDFQIYQVSAVDEYGELTPTDDFTRFSQMLDIRGENAESWQAAALRLEQYLLSEEIIAPIAMAKTDRYGCASFPAEGKPLSQGLYLVMGAHRSEGDYVYSTAPFFVQLPCREGNDWRYSVSAETKPERTEKTISLGVVKKWKDKYNEDQRPASIWITLYCDGTEYAGISLPKNGRWEYRWEGLEAGHSWWVAETEVDGYRSGVKRLGDTFLVENTYINEVGDARLPQTGQLWWPVPILTAAGLLLILVGLILRRGVENEKEMGE